MLIVLPGTGVAFAQDDASDGDDAEPAQYGDAELFETLREYGLLDEWIAASPVSPQASLLSVSSGSYLGQRRAFLNSLETWALQTEQLRTDLARIDAAQARVDVVRSAIISARDALVNDDRLTGPNSDTLAVIAAALEQVAPQAASDSEQELPQEPPTDAEILLQGIDMRAEAELRALNSSTAAVNLSGVTAFLGFNDLEIDLLEVEQLLDRSRESLRPAQRQADQLAASSLGQVPNLHAARLLGSTDVDGISLVTIDAYIRGAARSTCSVDWALLAGIGSIESKHGRLGGASVSRSGQVSPQIFGPLLDGGASEVDDGPLVAPIQSWWDSVRSSMADPSNSESGRGERDLEGADEEDTGNGFAVIVDSDDGRLDGNDEWDRAIGPMQFLPETWSRWATDGNGDGVSDPHNLYDATASAARFLCHLSATRGSSPSTFLRGYNDSASYVRSVLATAARLRSVSLPSG